MKIVKRIAFGAVAIIVVAALVIIVYNFMPDQSKPSVEAISVSLNGSLSDIGELVTSEYGYTLAQTASKPHKEVAGFKIPFTDAKVIYSYSGTVKAGVDFGSIGLSVNNETKAIKIDMPEARIMSSEVDHDSLIVYDEKYSPFNTFTFDDMNLSVAELQRSAENQAISGGLLDRAAENAQKLVLTAVEQFFGEDEYTVEFE